MDRSFGALLAPSQLRLHLVVAHQRDHESDRGDYADEAIYEALSREFVRRWRERLGRGTSLTLVFIVPVGRWPCLAPCRRAGPP